MESLTNANLSNIVYTCMQTNVRLLLDILKCGWPMLIHTLLLIKASPYTDQYLNTTKFSARFCKMGITETAELT